MATISMRIFRISLILVIAFAMVHGQPLFNAGVQEDKESSISLPESPINATETKLPEIYSPKSDLHEPKNPADLAMKKSTEMESTPEISPPILKPEIPPSDLNPESELIAPPSTTVGPQNPCSLVNQDCESASKPGNNLDQRRIDYDQRQNGTENYRIQVDGLVLVLAPIEALLLAGGLGSEMNGQFNLTSTLDQPSLKPDDEQSSSISSRPELEKPSHSVQKPMFYTAPKAADGPVSIKLINLIAPLLEHRRH